MNERTTGGIEVEHPRCPFCHAPVKPGPDEPKQSCGECMAWHHAECWESHGGCSACKQRRPAVNASGAAKVAPRRRMAVVAVALAVALGLLVVARWQPRGSAWHTSFLAAATEEEKTQWCRVGAEAGDPAAMNLLGFRLAGGIGCPKDQVEAVRWGRRGADLGHSNAMFGLARMLEGGFGTAQDLREAALWYRRALQAGDPQAQECLEDLLRRHPELRDGALGAH